MKDKSMLIEELLVNLQNPEASIRYKAREGLRDALGITPEEIKALEEAVNDPDPEVADAARRALEVLQPSTPSPELVPSEPAKISLIETSAAQSLPGEHLSWIQVWIKAITEPHVASFQQILDDPAARMTRGLIWLFTVSLIYALISMLVSFISYQRFSDYGLGTETDYSILLILCGTPIIAIITMVGYLLSSAIFNLIARLLGGEGNFEKLVYITSAFISPMLLITGVIAFIPIVNLLSYLTGIYTLVLYVVAFMTVYKFSTGKAILAYFLPTIVACIIFAGSIIVLVPVLANLSQ
jgi:hypothetical protein